MTARVNGTCCESVSPGCLIVSTTCEPMRPRINRTASLIAMPTVAVRLVMPLQAAAISYYALFSVFPLALLGSGLQAMVFTVLTTIYILLMLPHDHGHDHDHDH